MVHILHALKQGEQTIYVRTVAPDVVVGTFHNLVATQRLADISVAFDMGKNDRFYHFNANCETWGATITSVTCVSTFQVVTQLLPSRAREIRRFGSPGRHIKT